MALTRLPSFTLLNTDSFTFANLTLTSNVTANNANLGNAVSANYFIGNGTYLTNVTAIAANIANTVSVNAQPNITSVGILSSLQVSGNTVIGGNLIVNGTTTSINSTIVEIDDLAIVLANDASTSTQANGAGIIINGASANILYINASNSFVFSHKITADGSLLSNLTGANVTGTVANATVAASANSVAVANVVGIGNIATVNKDGNGSNILYGNGVFASAPVTYGNSNVATFLASFGSNSLTTTGNVSVGNIIGNGQALTGLAGANVTGQVANALIAGTVYTNAQPNITSVGTLTSLVVTGDSNISNLNLTGNIYRANGDFSISAGNGRIILDGYRWPAADGITGQVLATDGTGNLSWADGGTGGGGGSANALFFTDTFTGDGSTTNFVLRTDLTSKDQITVIYDGAVIMKSDYTLSGNTVTFTSAPDTGSLLEISAIGLQGAVFTTGVANVVADSSQPNITQLGSLVSLESIGTVDFGNASSLYLPTVSNVKMGGGNSGQYLRTDGTGNIYWGSLGNVAVTSDTAPSTPGAGALWLNTLTGELAVYYGGWVIIGGGVSLNIPYFAGANIVGAVANATFANTATVAFTVSTNAQPNITSVGTLTNVSISGNTVTNNVSANTGNIVTFTSANASISNLTATLSATASNQPNVTTVGTLGNLAVSANISTGNLSVSANTTIAGWLTQQQSTEVYISLTGATGVVTHNLNTGATFYHTSPAANFTVNFTNVPTTDLRISIASLIINQGSTGYFPNSIQIDGAAQTIKWLSGIVPTASSSKVDIVTFSLLRSGSSWVVMGHLATYA